MKGLFFAVMCFVSVATAVDSGFPADPAGVEIIDRAFYREETTLYIRLFNREEQGTVELFKGFSADGVYNWELIYTWQPTMYNESPVTFEPVTVLSLQSDSHHLLITWIDRLYCEYHEGLASLYLEYDLEKGGIDEVLLD